MTIPIVTACDERFAPGLEALLTSVAINAPLSRVHVMDCGLTTTTRRSIARSHPRTDFISVQPIEDLPSPSVGSRATYARLCVGDLFPDAKRILYLDADTLLLSDTEYLEGVDLPHSDVLAACLEPYTPTFDAHNGVLDYQKLGLLGGSPYFNAGVLLVDVARWNRANVKERAVEYLRRQDVRITLYDQEALNVVLVSRWHSLPPEWNVSKYWVVGGPDGWRHAIDRARIVHFLSAEKPWLDPTKVEPLLLEKFRQYSRSPRGS